MIWTTFGYLYDAIFRQYFKGAYDVRAIAMATVQLSKKKKASKTQFTLIIFKTNSVIYQFLGQFGKNNWFFFSFWRYDKNLSSGKSSSFPKGCYQIRKKVG